MGHKVSATKIGRLLQDIGYSLQVVRETREGIQSPDRNAQFEHINRTAKRFIARGQPVVAVDTKKKELIGDFKNGGREWQPQGSSTPVRVHVFIDKDLGKVIPYGVYDTARNEAWVSVGVDHHTAEFAVATLSPPGTHARPLVPWPISSSARVFRHADGICVSPAVSRATGCSRRGAGDRASLAASFPLLRNGCVSTPRTLRTGSR